MEMVAFGGFVKLVEFILSILTSGVWMFAFDKHMIKGLYYKREHKKNDSFENNDLDNVKENIMKEASTRRRIDSVFGLTWLKTRLMSPCC